MNTELLRHTEKLYYFYEAALSGSLQAAARKLRTTASTLSYAIKQLEEVLEGELFIRSHKGVKTTDTGELLFLFCKKFFHELDDIHATTKSKQKQIVRLRLGTFASIAIYLGPLLWQAVQEDGSTSISITTNRSKDILESMLNKDIHLAITVEALKHPNLITHELYNDYYSCYISSSLAPNAVTSAWLRRNSLIYMHDASDSDGKNLANYTHDWNIQFKDHFELDSLEVVAEFTCKGLGIGILPNNVAGMRGEQLAVLKLPGVPYRFGYHRFFFSYRDDLDLSQKIIKRVHKLAEVATSQMKTSLL